LTSQPALSLTVPHISSTSRSFTPTHHKRAINRVSTGNVRNAVPHTLRNALIILPSWQPHGTFRHLPWLASPAAKGPHYNSPGAVSWNNLCLRRPKTPPHPLNHRASPELSDTHSYISLAMLSISWVSSFTIQIPLQQRIRKHDDSEAVKKLISTDWMRVLTMSAHFVAVLFSVVG
jgi:hypothetical protein